MQESSEQARSGISRRALLAGAAAGGAGLAATLAEPGIAAASSSFGGDQRPVVAQLPPTVFHVQLEAGGVVVGSFAEVVGLSSESEVLEFRDGGDPDQTRKLPGKTTYSNIELSRGLSSDMALAQWRGQVEAGLIKEAKKNGSIVLYDQSHAEFARWHFENGWPSKYEASALKAGSSEVLMETITIVCEHLERVAV